MNPSLVTAINDPISPSPLLSHFLSSLPHRRLAAGFLGKGLRLGNVKEMQNSVGSCVWRCFNPSFLPWKRVLKVTGAQLTPSW
ncbi:unnamed protein product [Arabidopsis halleri]